MKPTAINMVNDLIRLKVSAQLYFHHNTVLKDITAKALPLDCTNAGMIVSAQLEHVATTVHLASRPPLWVSRPTPHSRSAAAIYAKVLQ